MVRSAAHGSIESTMRTYLAALLLLPLILAACTAAGQSATVVAEGPALITFYTDN